MINYLFLFLLFSCSHLPKGTHVKKIPVENEIQAKGVVQNQVNFLTELFKQTKDPYYNVQKWHELCLNENKIGLIKETDRMIISSSSLFLMNGEPGSCSYEKGSEHHQVIYLYCKGSKEVLELKLPLDPKTPINEKDLCH